MGTSLLPLRNRPALRFLECLLSSRISGHRQFIFGSRVDIRNVVLGISSSDRLAIAYTNPTRC